METDTLTGKVNAVLTQARQCAPNSRSCFKISRILAVLSILLKTIQQQPSRRVARCIH